MIEIIKKFIEEKDLALIGVSKNPNKFGNSLVKELNKLGYRIHPVHPQLKEVEGTKCYRSLNDLPEKVKNLILVVQPQATEEIIREINPAKIKRVWMHKGAGSGSSSPKAIQECREKGIEVVYGFCPMMFLAHTGIHRFHLWMRKTFGKIPQEAAGFKFQSS
jgi:predicted CoA-binding protein